MDMQTIESFVKEINKLVEEARVTALALKEKAGASREIDIHDPCFDKFTKAHAILNNFLTWQKGFNKKMNQVGKMYDGFLESFKFKNSLAQAETTKEVLEAVERHEKVVTAVKKKFEEEAAKKGLKTDNLHFI